MTATPNDPLGIHALSEKIEALLSRISVLEEAMSEGSETMISEEKLMRVTEFKPATLRRLRKEGKVRFYKPGQQVAYLLSEFNDDIKNIKP